MPLYEYECRACGQQCELLIRGSEEPSCPHCGSTQLDRQLSVPAAHTGGSRRELPVCEPNRGGGCGLPQCGGGQCAFE